MKKKHRKRLEQRLEDLLSLIPKGRENARHMKEISYLSGYSEREVREGSTSLRINGYIIAGDQYGYYIPETIEELRSYVKLVTERQKTTAKSLAAAKRKLKEMEGQDDSPQKKG